MTRQFKVPVNAPGVSVNGTAVSVDGHTHAGGGGAPADATYVVTSSDGTLTNERVLTQGSYLTITDNGSSTVTIAVDATNANTASKVVARDASGNFSAGTITAALTGNASTATALSSSRTFALTGDVTGSVSSDLTSGASIAASIGTGKVTSTHILDGTIVNDDISATAGIVDTKLATISTAGKVANTATTATASNGASTIVLRDASQNFSTAGTITAGGFSGPLTGNVTGTATGNLASTLADAKGEIPVGTASGPSSITPGAGTDGYVLTADSTQTVGVKWAAASGGGSTYVAEFSKAGTVATGTGTFRWYNDSGSTLTIKAIRASCGTAPTGTTSTPVTGASLVLDVNIGTGTSTPTTIWSTQTNRLNIQAAANTGSKTSFNTSTIANGDYFTVDIDFVGSTVAGSDLTVSIWLT